MKKLTLNRETLKSLDADRSRFVAAGIDEATNVISSFWIYKCGLTRLQACSRYCPKPPAQQ